MIGPEFAEPKGGSKMDWNEEAACKAVSEFHSLLGELETKYQGCIDRLRSSWKECYMHCGHKRLGRIVLGYSPEEACAKRQAAAT